MPYRIRYNVQSLGKQGWTFSLNIRDKDLDLNLPISIETDLDPFVEKLLARNDDPFEPIVAKELSLAVDITDLSLWPDLTNEDDKKYFGELSASKDGNTVLLFRGWLLADVVTLPFTTGMQRLKLDFVDGLAMLKDIPFTPAGVDINERASLLSVILICMNKIGIPVNGFSLTVAVSIYADGMDDRGDGPEYEPFSQTYLPTSEWLNSDLTYQDCYTVLESIVKSWGCQLFQNKGQYVIANVNERASDQIYYTTYDEEGVVTDSGQMTINKLIEPFTSEAATPLYFINNSQLKVLKKGFKEIQLKHDFAYSYNGIDNGDLERRDGSDDADNWDAVASGTGASIDQSTTVLNGRRMFVMNAGTGVNTSFAYVEPQSVSDVYQGAVLRLSFIFACSGVVPGAPGMYVVIRANNGSITNYALNADNEWVLNGSNYYEVPVTADLQKITITTPPCPVSGPLLLQFLIHNGTQSGRPGTQLDAEILDFVLRLSDNQNYQLISANKGTSAYKKVIEIPQGQGSGSNGLLRGTYTDSTGQPYQIWYRYGVTESQSSLMRILLQQYINVFFGASINVEGTIRSIFPGDELVETFISMQVEDPTTNNLTVDTKRYIFGNTTVNYQRDEISTSLLEIRNTDLPATITDEVILDSDL